MACVICDKLKEKKAHILYEDDLVMCILPAKGAAPGHMRVLPKKHATKLEEMDDALVERLFMIANYASASAFDTLKAHGTNILLNEGQDHLAIDVLPRKEGDGMDFLWPPKEMPQNEMDDVFSKIKDKIVVGKGSAPEKPASVPGTLPVETIVVPERKEKKAEKKEPEAESRKEEKKPQEQKEEGNKEEESKSKDEPSDEETEEGIDPEDENYMIRQLRKIP